MDERKHVHGPVGVGQCTMCHDPHESENKKLLKINEEELCYTCHESMDEEKFVHGPVALAQCLTCHDPHGSENSSILNSPAEELCFTCHGDRITEKNIVHGDEMLNDCTSCHNAHASSHKYQLVSELPGLCSDCHGDVGSVKFPHFPVFEGMCLDCHNAHNSDAAGQTKYNGESNLCFECHTDIEEKVASSKFVHNMVGENCIECHNPHGSENPNILNKYFSPNFYNIYSNENHALCSECHYVTESIEKENNVITEFRNGEENLHFVHVTAKPQKARNCKVCHDPHASNQEKFIKKESPFGKSLDEAKYMIPIDFTKTETGGTCATGCHKPKSYDRINPVVY